MKKTILTVLVFGIGPGLASAGPVTPTDVVFDAGAVSASLTGVAGDPAAGKKAFINRKQGNCLACHATSDLKDQPFHGEIGPALDGVAGRWDTAHLRGIVSNPKNTFEGTIMPAFFRDSGFKRVKKKFQGKTILTAQQVEDVVAYLNTLK